MLHRKEAAEEGDVQAQADCYGVGNAQRYCLTDRNYFVI